MDNPMKLIDELTRNQIALTVFLTAVVLGSVPFVISNTSVDGEVVKFNPSANVTQPENTSGNASLGVAPGSEGLDYGELPIEVTKQARKEVDLNASKKALIVISSSGNASEYLRYNKTHYFEGFKQIEIGFETEGTGYYEGELKMKILTPKNGIGRAWLDLRSQLYF